MFINLKNDKPAFLIEHDGDVIYSSARDGAPKHTVDSFEFFSTHREATPEEIEEYERKSVPNKNISDTKGETKVVEKPTDVSDKALSNPANLGSGKDEKK